MPFERCNHCLRPYQLNAFASEPLNWAPAAETLCPHCGHPEARAGDSVFIVHAMTPEEEAAFDADYPFESRDGGIADHD